MILRMTVLQYILTMKMQFIDQISEDLQTKYNMSAKQANNVIYNGGLQIYSNYDSRIQGIVDNVMLDDSNFLSQITA